MKHLYPVLTKRIALLLVIIIYSVVGESQALNFDSPVLSFTTQLTNNKVWLAWSTSQDVNVSHYFIERSYDNKTFEQAALIFTAEDPAPVNNYSYKDPIKNVTGSLIYYRLKMVDKDGKYKYTEVKTVRLGAGNYRDV